MKFKNILTEINIGIVAAILCLSIFIAGVLAIKNKGSNGIFIFFIVGIQIVLILSIIAITTM